MIRKFYEKSELWFSIVCIIIYVMVMGNLQANFGTDSIYTMLGLLAIVLALISFIVRNGLQNKYGLVKAHNTRRYLYFIPLALITSVNLWNGIELHYDLSGQLIAVTAMALSGIAEELIFRGLLFRAIEKDNVKHAVIITSITFGIGHIVNLFTGEQTLETLLQVCYAIAIGFAFAMTFLKSGSILPCIFAHSLINTTAEISGEGNTIIMYIQVLFLIVVSASYAIYLFKLRKEQQMK